VTEVFSAQLAPLGLTVTDFSLTPPEVPACAVDGVATLLRDKGVGEDERLIVVNANASDLSTERRWPLEQFVTLVTAAAALPGHRLILVGSPEETDYVGRLHASLPVAVQQKVLNVAGNLSVDEFIALIKRVDLCITNDSGPLHIAAAQGVSTVSFFGPETPTLYGPVGPNHEIFYADLYCSPCLNVYNAKRAMCNGDNRCMQSITADMVIERLREKGIL
jgi:ADP-heptose:LPS heptosyltransferase